MQEKEQPNRPQPTREELEHTAKKAVNKYYKNYGHVVCPRCSRPTNTVIISNSITCCPFCQKMNVLDMFSVLSKTKEGKDKVHAVLSYIKDNRHDENNMQVSAPTYTLWSKIQHFLSRGSKSKKIKRFGSLKFYVNHKLLADPLAFDKEFSVVCAFAPQALITQFMGKDVRVGIDKPIQGEGKVLKPKTEQNGSAPSAENMEGESDSQTTSSD